MGLPRVLPYAEVIPGLMDSECCEGAPLQVRCGCGAIRFGMPGVMDRCGPGLMFMFRCGPGVMVPWERAPGVIERCCCCWEFGVMLRICEPGVMLFMLRVCEPGVMFEPRDGGAGELARVSKGLMLPEMGDGRTACSGRMGEAWFTGEMASLSLFASRPM